MFSYLLSSLLYHTAHRTISNRIVGRRARKCIIKGKMSTLNLIVYIIYIIRHNVSL
jgi:hypothetical protein